MVITQQALKRTALHAVAVAAMAALAATAAMGRIRRHPAPHRTHHRPTLRREVVEEAGPAGVRSRVGRGPVHLWHIRLPKCWHSRLSATAWRS